jgi:phosphoribosylaminoimidazole-succinocarboxamide synthase
VGDEFTPDGCRLSNRKTGKTPDKVRFRRDLGEGIEGYRQMGR